MLGSYSEQREVNLAGRTQGNPGQKIGKLGHEKKCHFILKDQQVFRDSRFMSVSLPGPRWGICPTVCSCLLELLKPHSCCPNVVRLAWPVRRRPRAPLDGTRIRHCTLVKVKSVQPVAQCTTCATNVPALPSGK